MKEAFYFDRPSMRFDEGLPLGNGRIGATVLGGCRERFIHLNEETVWYGGPRDRHNPDALSSMREIRRLMRAGEIEKAERLSLLALTGTPETQRHFTTLGIAVIDMEGQRDKDATAYRHALDLDIATASQQYTMDGACYQTRTFVSIPHGVVAMKLTCDRPALSFFAGVERGERVAQFSYGTHEDLSYQISPNGVCCEGNLGGREGLDFGIVMAGVSDGTFRLIGDKIVVENATHAELFIAAGTNFEGVSPKEAALARCLAALSHGFDAVYQDHLTSWQSLYAICDVELPDLPTLPAMNRLYEAFAKNDLTALGFGTEQAYDRLSDALSLTLFRYGRYLLLSSGHDSLLPAALQGLWCRDLLSIWDAKYTTNINLQMCYWPVDSANMPTCFDGYLRLCERIHKNGTETARRMYACRGFVLHNNTDIWADTAVQDAGTHCSYWFAGGFWIAADLWEHFLYTRDPAYLARVYPILRDAALFAVDFMEEQDGQLVMGVTTSPENSYYLENGHRVSFCRMTAMDSQLIGLALRNALAAMELLGVDDSALAAELRDTAVRLMPTQVGEDGSALEWSQPLPEAEKSHRHQSMVIGAFPYDWIDESTPELRNAVATSLANRRAAGGVNTGWSRAWAGGLYARLGCGNDARDMLSGMARLSGQPNLFSCCNVGRAPKLMEDAMPMQMDGNMGTVQALVEMLLQSHSGVIRLLPALPTTWQAGSFHGLVARGNVEVDCVWQGGHVTSAQFRPRVSGTLVLDIEGLRIPVEATAGVPFTWEGGQLC